MVNPESAPGVGVLVLAGVLLLSTSIGSAEVRPGSMDGGADPAATRLLGALKAIHQRISSGVRIDAEGRRTYFVRFTADPDAGPDQAGLRRELRQPQDRPVNVFRTQTLICGDSFQHRHEPLEVGQVGAEEADPYGYAFVAGSGSTVVAFSQKSVMHSEQLDPKTALPQSYDALVKMQWLLAPTVQDWSRHWTATSGRAEWFPDAAPAPVSRRVTRREGDFILIETVEVPAVTTGGKSVTIGRRIRFRVEGEVLVPVLVELLHNNDIGKRWELDWIAADSSSMALTGALRPQRVEISGFEPLPPHGRVRTSLTAFEITKFEEVDCQSDSASLAIEVPGSFRVLSLGPDGLPREDGHASAGASAVLTQVSGSWLSLRWLWPLLAAAGSIVGLVLLRRAAARRAG